MDKIKKFVADRKGYFLIRLRKGYIEAGLFSYKKKLKKLFRGKTAKTLINKIIDSGSVSRMEHAAYIGRELQKAECALKTGKEYIQDEKFK